MRNEYAFGIDIKTYGRRLKFKFLFQLSSNKKTIKYSNDCVNVLRGTINGIMITESTKSLIKIFHKGHINVFPL